MADWVNCLIFISHDDIDEIKSLCQRVGNARDGVFNLFCPILDEDYSNELAISRWGTKWDVYPEDSPAAACRPESAIEWLEEHLDEGESNGGSLSFSCNTASNPPRRFLKELVRQGFSVSCKYEDPSMGIGGEWCDGSEDQYNLPREYEELEWSSGNTHEAAKYTIEEGVYVSIVGSMGSVDAVEILAYGMDEHQRKLLYVLPYPGTVGNTARYICEDEIYFLRTVPKSCPEKTVASFPKELDVYFLMSGTFYMKQPRQGPDPLAGFWALQEKAVVEGS